MMRDPLAAAFHSRGTYSGVVRLGVSERAVIITPEERDLAVKRFEMDRLDQICTSCGSTKPMTFYKAIGAISCCEARKMVPVADYLAQMAAAKAELAAAKAKLAKLRKRRKAAHAG